MKQVNGLWLPDSDTHFAGYREMNFSVGNIPDYEIGTRRVALGLTKQRRVALDVGAHVGIWTRHLAEEFDTVWAM